MKTPRPPQRVETFDLSAVPVTRTDFPGLDRVGSKIARALGAVLASAGQALSVACGGVRTMTLRDWQSTLPPQIAVARYRDPVIKGGLLLSLPPSIIAALVDAYYGGDGDTTGVPTVFGAAEQRMFERLAQSSSAAIVAGWADVAPLAPKLEASFAAQDDIAFGKLDDLVVVQRFALGPRYPDDEVALVYPVGALRGMAGLQKGRKDAPSDAVNIERDPVWQRRLSDAVMQSRLPVRTVIARPTVPLHRLMSLAPGDFIPVTLPARVPLTVAGRLLAHGTIGEANGRAAIMIDRIEPGAFND